MNAIKEAEKLLKKLKARALANPEAFGENYGQKEISKFENRMADANVHFVERTRALEIICTISSFSPLD